MSSVCFVFREYIGFRESPFYGKTTRQIRRLNQQLEGQVLKLHRVLRLHPEGMPENSLSLRSRATTPTDYYCPCDAGSQPSFSPNGAWVLKLIGFSLNSSSAGTVTGIGEPIRLGSTD